MNPRTLLLALASLACLLASLASADGGDWPRWRGPNDNGSADGGTYPVKFSGTEGFLWKAPLPGKGCSTPIVWKGRIILTAPVDDQDAVLAFGWSGKELWRTTLGPQKKGKHRNGSGCNPSCVTDGRGVWACFKSGTLAGLDMDGKLLWKTNLHERFGPDNLYWDFGTSPVQTEKDVVIALMRHGNSCLAAFDKTTGKLRWKVDRNYKTPNEGDHSYATPIVIRDRGRQAVLVWGGQHLTAHGAADGRVLWSCGEFNPDSTILWPAVASPVIAGDIAVVPYGRGKRLHGIRLGGSGDVTSTARLWVRDDTGSFCPTPAVHAGKVYLLRDRGEIECIDPATGKTLWADKLPPKAPSYYASPSIADGKLYAAREDGLLYVVRIEGKFEVLSANDMGERVIASPVPVAGRLLIRGDKHLFCIGTER